jgi:hypothetical protein
MDDHRDFLDTKVNIIDPVQADTSAFRRVVLADKFMNYCYYSNNSFEFDDYGQPIMGTLGLWDKTVKPLQAYQALALKANYEGQRLLPQLPGRYRDILQRILRAYMRGFNRTLDDMRSGLTGYCYGTLSDINYDMTAQVNSRIHQHRPVESILVDGEIRKNSVDLSIWGYVLATQGTIDSIYELANSHHYAGALDTIAPKVDSLISILKSTTDVTAIQIDGLNEDSATARYVREINSLPNNRFARMEALIRLGNAILMNSTYYRCVKTGTNTLDQIPDIVEQGAGMALGDTTFTMALSNTQRRLESLNNCFNIQVSPNMTITQRLMVCLSSNQEDYEVLIRDLQNNLAGNDTIWISAHLEGIFSANDSLTDAYEMALSPLISAYPTACLTIANYPEFYTITEQSIQTSAEERALLDFMILEYLSEPNQETSQMLFNQCLLVLAANAQADYWHFVYNSGDTAFNDF